MVSKAYCWGANNLGQIGYGGTLARQLRPTAVQGTLTFQFVRSGYYHTCGLSTVGPVYCWGSNANGQIGDAGGGVSATDMVTSPTIIDDNQAFISLDVGGTHSCAISANGGEVYCWGTNTLGQLGGTTTTMCRSTVPCDISPLRMRTTLVFNAISLGTSHSCAMLSTGETYC